MEGCRDRATVVGYIWHSQYEGFVNYTYLEKRMLKSVVINPITEHFLYEIIKFHDVEL